METHELNRILVIGAGHSTPIRAQSSAMQSNAIQLGALAAYLSIATRALDRAAQVSLEGNHT